MKHGLLKACIFFAIMFLFSAMVNAQNTPYYVATDGDDSSGDGSLAHPWATITHALETVPDNSTVLVRPGTYTGQVDLMGSFTQGVVVRSEIPYQARLRSNQTVVRGFYGRGITLEGFDIAHHGFGAEKYVIQIQDLRSEVPGGGPDGVADITLRNNIIHDSYNNDLLKVSNGASYITVEGNMFYNQEGSDSHIDVNGATYITIQDNLFFNNFAGSGRENDNSTGSYIVIKDSKQGEDVNEGSQYITVRRNILFNWQGKPSNTYIVVGEDSVSYYQARDVLIENNLLLGNSENIIRAAFGVKGARDITFRHNTVVGDLPAKAFAMRLTVQQNNPRNESIRFYNNIWSDPTGTMGAENDAQDNDFSDTSPQETASFHLDHNLYWNGGNEIPHSDDELVNFLDDAHHHLADPMLAAQTFIILPTWIAANQQFADGSTTIRQVFQALVKQYGVPAVNSTVIDSANPTYSPHEDILGNPRAIAPDIGAYEHQHETPTPPLERKHRVHLPLVVN